MQKRILVTGASGNVGKAVIDYLSLIAADSKIIVGARNMQKSKELFVNFPHLEYVHLDFEQPSTFQKALSGIDTVFLLRPPHISNIKKYIAPFIEKISEKSINDILFLSVQGADKSRLIPHAKIEKLILEQNLNYIFLRPSYFMQNLTTILLEDIIKHREIILPAGKAKFNWVDAGNVGEMAAILLNDFDRYKNNIYEITGYENKSFEEVVRQLSEIAGQNITYTSVNPIQFFRIKKKEGMKKGKIMVMIMLHFFTRFQKQPPISTFYEQLTGKKPITLAEFIIREKSVFNIQ